MGLDWKKARGKEGNGVAVFLSVLTGEFISADCSSEFDVTKQIKSPRLVSLLYPKYDKKITSETHDVEKRRTSASFSGNPGEN